MQKGHLYCEGSDLLHASSSSTSHGERTDPSSDGSSGAPSFEGGQWTHTLSGFLRWVETASTTLSTRGTRDRCDSNSSLGENNDKFVICASVGVLGNSGSGRTSLAAAVSKVALRFHSSLDFQSASSGSFLTYAYKPSVSRQKKYVQLTVIDNGPVPLRGGAARHVIQRCETVIITFSLTGIKQKRMSIKNFFKFREKSRLSEENLQVFVHSKDKALLYNLFAMVAAQISPRATRPNIVLVGTHKDLLTDQSPGAMELLLGELRSICSSFLATFQQSLVLSSLFAVSLIDGSCVSENRGGPSTVATMWSFICDVAVKDATWRHHSKSHKLSFSQSLWRDHQLLSFSRNPDEILDVVNENCSTHSKELVDKKQTSSYHGSQVIPPSFDSLIYSVNEKFFHFLFRVKAEKKTIFLHHSTLWRLMYSHGLISKKHLILLLEKLQHAGQIYLFNHHARGMISGNACICLHPNLIERAQTTIFLYASHAGNRCNAHGKLLTCVNLERCKSCDPSYGVLRGVFSQSLLFELSPRLKLSCSLSKATEVFAMLLTLSGTAFRRQSRVTCVASGEGDSFAVSSLTTEGVEVTGRALPSYMFDSWSMVESFLGANLTSESETVPALYCPSHVEKSDIVEYVVPSLIRVRCPDVVIECVRRLANMLNGGEIGTHNSHAITIVWTMRPCPLNFFPVLTTRLHHYIVPNSPIFSEALWLCSSAPATEASPLLRMCVYHVESKCVEGATGEQSKTVSLLELHAFSDVGYLPLVLFVDAITRKIARMIRHQFPGMSTWAVTNKTPIGDECLIGNDAHIDAKNGVHKLHEVDTLRKLDVLFHSLYY